MASNAEIIVRIVDQTSSGANSVKRNLDGVEKSTSRVTKGFNGIAAAAAGFIASISGTAIAGYLSEIQNLDNRLRLVTGTQDELNQTFDQLAYVAERTRAPLNETINLYSRIALSADSIGLSQQEVIQVTENFSKALAISGASSSEAASAMTQFSQALAGGVLRGEEFNAINEAAPRVMQVLADQLGVTRGQLRSYAEDGLLTADVVTRALIEATGDLEEQFAQTDVTIGQAATNVSNSFLQMVRDFDATTGASGLLVDALEVMAENMDIVVGVAGALATVIGGVLIAGIAGISAPVTGAIAAIAGLGAVIVSFGDDVVDAFNTAGRYVDAFFSGLSAAFRDPLNAFDEFERAFEQSLVDSLQEGVKAQENLAKEIDNTVDSVEDESDAVAENSDRLDENSMSARELLENNQRLETGVKRVESAYRDFSSALEDSVRLARLSTVEREIETEVMRGLEAQAKALGKEVEDLTETERANVREYVTQQVQKRQANQEYQEAVRQLERDSQRIIQDANRDTNAELIRLENERSEFIRRANELNLENTQETLDAILAYDELIAMERNKIAQERLQEWYDLNSSYQEQEQTAYERYLNRRNEFFYDYNRSQIEDERLKNEVLRALNKEYVDDVTREYDDLYGLLNDKLMDLTGVSRREFGIIEEVVQLTFGVNITDIIKQTFASGIATILGFRTQGTNELNGMGQSVGPIFGGIGGTIEGTFLQTGLNAIGNFVLGGLGALGGLASDIFSLFGGVGDFLGNVFGGAFSSISSGISNFFGGLTGTGGGGGFMGGLGSAIGSFFGPVGSVVGGIVDFFFADGGYIPAGGVGIVGEAGPEIVSGPAMVTSTRDTADILDGMGSNVNVTFNINAVDARGIDELLVNRRDTITGIVRSAVEEKGRRFA